MVIYEKNLFYFAFLCGVCAQIDVHADSTPFRTLFEVNRDTILNMNFERTGVLNVLSPARIKGLSIDASITLLSDKGFVRILLEDVEGQKFLILEATSMRASSRNLSYTNYCEETAYLENVVPRKVTCYVENAILNLKKISFVEEQGKNGQQHRVASRVARESLKRKQIQVVVDQINAYNERNDIPWWADVTPLSLKSFSDRQRILGCESDDVDTKGFEYYSSGLFVVGEESPNSENIFRSQSSSPYVPEFDWRNRHGVNWLTKSQDQGNSGYCWAFATCSALEAKTNLYFNRKIALDLSEQDLVYSVAGDGPQSVESLYGGILNVSWTLESVLRHGVLDEETQPFVDAPQSYIPPRPNGVECIRTFSTKRSEVSSLNIDSVKNLLIHHGPLVSGIYRSGKHNHAMSLVGYHVIQVGDTIRPVGPAGPSKALVVGEGHPFLGKNYWVFKDNYIIPGDMDREKGFMYICFTDYSCMRPIDYFDDARVTSLQYTDDDVLCTDNDGDGYFNWGSGNRPARCPVWAPAESDGDDSDFLKGPMDRYGFCEKLSSTRMRYVYIENDTILPANILVKNNYVVWRGGKLRIGATTNFARGSKIIVDANSSLFLDGVDLSQGTVLPQPGCQIKLKNGAQVGKNPATGDFVLPLGATLEISQGTVR